jgi:hypothetical protein
MPRDQSPLALLMPSARKMVLRTQSSEERGFHQHLPSVICDDILSDVEVRSLIDVLDRPRYRLSLVPGQLYVNEHIKEKDYIR